MNHILIGKEKNGQRKKNTEPRLKHSSHNICVLPWVHVNLNPNGEVVPCCVSTNNYVIGDLNNQPIEDIWNSPRMVNLRQQFLDGKKPSTCNFRFFFWNRIEHLWN